MSISFNPSITKPAFSSPKMLPTSLSSTGPLTLSVPTDNSRPAMDVISSSNHPAPPFLPPGPWPYTPGHLPSGLFNPASGHSAFSDNLTTSSMPPFQAPVGGNALMENLENWRQFQQAAYANNLDPHLLAFYHSNGCAMDLSNAPRRKNATRETTSMLKAWLNEHRKNPYPTKGEKIMLAIITKMTLTQVSTWFANARRRLKKENKMTWSPRNRSEEERGDQDRHSHCDRDSCKDEEEEDEDERESDGSLNVDGDDENDLDDLENYTMASLIEKNKTFLLNKCNSGDVKVTVSANDSSRKRPATKDSLKPGDYDQETNLESIKKAKIWSLADFAAKPESRSPSATLPKLSSHSFTSSNHFLNSSSLAGGDTAITSMANMSLPLCFMDSQSSILSKLLPNGPGGGGGGGGGLLPPGMTSLSAPGGIMPGHHLPHYSPALFNLPPNPFFFGGGFVTGLHPLMKTFPKLGHQESMPDLARAMLQDSSSKS